MDEDKGVIPWSNEKWTCGIERTFLLTKSPKSVWGGGGGEERATEREKEKCGIFRERSSTFSLESPAIRPSDSFATRMRVVLHEEDNAWTLVLGSFDKIRER